MSNCECNLAGLLSVNFQGIVSANLNGSTTVDISDDGLVLIGQTINTLSITGHPFLPGGDIFLGVRCTSQASVSCDWLQKYDCINDIVYFISQSGGKASLVGDSIRGVSLLCDPNIVGRFYNASASSGPATPVITSNRRDGFGLSYTGGPISINTNEPRTYNIRIGSDSFNCYLQNFSINVSPPTPASVSYSFVFSVLIQ
jgi:hypothetical protein